MRQLKKSTMSGTPNERENMTVSMLLQIEPLQLTTRENHFEHAAAFILATISRDVKVTKVSAQLIKKIYLKIHNLKNQYK